MFSTIFSLSRCFSTSRFRVTSKALEQVFTVSNLGNRNALSIDILYSIHEFLKVNSCKSNIRFDFDSNSDILCSGLDLFELNVEEIRRGVDPFPQKHIACKVVEEFLNRKKNLATKDESTVIIDRDIYGFGLVFASLCKNIEWKKNVKLCLPHMRIGIAFPMLPISAVLSYFYTPLTVELFIRPIISYDEIKEKRIYYMGLSDPQKEKIDREYINILYRLARGEDSVNIDGRLYHIEDRSHNLKLLSYLHVKQIETYLECSGNLSLIPDSKLDDLELLRKMTMTPELSNSIIAHRKNVAVLNNTINDKNNLTP